MTPQEFATYRQRTLIGVSITVVPPLGQYDPDEADQPRHESLVVQAGDRALAHARPVGARGDGRRLDLHRQHDFVGGHTREQDPIVATQVHLTYRFKRATWLAADANFYTGGRTTIDGRQNLDLQRNSRIGATFSTRSIGIRRSACR